MLALIPAKVPFGFEGSGCLHHPDFKRYVAGCQVSQPQAPVQLRDRPLALCEPRQAITPRSCGGVLVKLLLFGRLRDSLGPTIDAPVPAAGCSVAELRTMLVDSDPAYAVFATPRVRACVDRVIVDDRFVISPGQEIAFIPPVSGG